MTVKTRPIAEASTESFTPELSTYTADEMLELLTTPVFDAIEATADEVLEDQAGRQVVDAEGNLVYASRIIANKGGSRSSKTRSLAQIIVLRCLARGGEYVVSLVRGTLPALRMSALKDVETVLKTTALPNGEGFLIDVVEHRSVDKVFVFPSGSQLQYFSIDDEQKIRGTARVDLWVNEANELEYEEWKQLLMRTTGQVFIDFNPSDDEHHWIPKHVLSRADCSVITSTYKDNPFLPQTLIDEIESYREADENYWKVYGLGEYGVSGTTIYSHYKQIDELPAGADYAYGLDFGFNHPTALVRVAEVDGRRYAEQLLYKSKLTSTQLIDELKELIPLLDRKNKIIYADAARPDLIEEIRLAGFNIVGADKSVKAGIDNVKAHPLFITRSSVDLLNEMRAYKWKVEAKTERVLEEPVKAKDDAVDALRYACYNMTLAPRTAATPVSTSQSFSRQDPNVAKVLGRQAAGAQPGKRYQSFKRK